MTGSPDVGSSVLGWQRHTIIKYLGYFRCSSPSFLACSFLSYSCKVDATSLGNLFIFQKERGWEGQRVKAVFHMSLFLLVIKQQLLSKNTRFCKNSFVILKTIKIRNNLISSQQGVFKKLGKKRQCKSDKRQYKSGPRYIT